MNDKKPVFIKQYTRWHGLKNKINSTTDIPAGYKERDVWWVSVGHNVGVEEDGKGELFTRPVLIVRGFSRMQFWGVPLSTTEKSGKYYYQFAVNKKISNALLSQLRVFDTKRLISKYGMAEQKDFQAIKTKLSELLMSPK